MNNYSYPPATTVLGIYDNRGERTRVTDGTFAENFSMLEQEGRTPQQSTNAPAQVQQPIQESAKPPVLHGTGCPTPMALLNEICTKSRLVIKTDITEEGPIHDRVFECFLKVLNNQTNTCDASVSGKGRTKKDAKHEAAKALLLKMDPRLEQMFAYNSPPLNPPGPPAAPVAVVVAAEPEGVESTGNPIGDLNDLCMKVKFPPPVYEDVVDGQEGSHVNPFFRIICRLHQKIYDIGEGFSKKQAKKVAAAKVLEKLRQVMKEPTTANAVFPDGDQDELCRRLAVFTVSKEKQPGPSDGPAQCACPKALVETVQTFKTRKGEKLEQLMGMKLIDFQKSDHVLILDEVTMEQNIKVEFLDFLPHLDEPKHKSILSLTLDDSRFIFIGNGINKVAARKAASFNGLDYFRLTYRYN